MDGEASSPATATLSKGEWLRMSHSVAKRLVFAEIFQISGRKNCKESIFALGNGISRRKNRPPPAYTPPGTIGIREGFGPLELSEGFFGSLCTGRENRRSVLFFVKRIENQMDMWYNSSRRCFTSGVDA